MPFFQAAEPVASRITADDLLALNTLALVEYLKQNPRLNGGFQLGNVDGWAVLPKAKRDHLRDKLRAAAAEANTPDATPGGQIDFNQLTARLNDVKNGAWSPRAAPSPESPRRTPSPHSQPVVIKSLEIAAYYELVGDGGRPLFPPELLDRVAENPEEHQAMLRPWAEDPDASGPDDWRVFSRQRDRWRDFRRWQRDNRKISDDDNGYSAFREAMRQRMILTGDAKVANAPRFEKMAGELWKLEINRRRRQREIVKEDHGDRGFSGYIEAATHRLKKHGFTQPTRFEEDPKQQGTWTTWIEYIAFVCWWLDRYIRCAEPSRSQFDEVWKTLGDSGILRPSETPESLCTVEASAKRESEEEEAERTVETAQEAVDSASEDTDSFGKASVPASAHIDLREAKESLEAIRNRNHLIRKFVQSTEGHRDAMKDVRRYHVLVQSLLELAPQIQVEEKQRKAVGDVPVATGSKKKRGRPVVQKATELSPRKQTSRADSDAAQDDEAHADTAQGEAAQRTGCKRGANFNVWADADRPSKRAKAEKPNETSAGANEEAAAQTLNIKATKEEVLGNSRWSHSASHTGSCGDIGTPGTGTTDEWVNRLRKRPEKMTAQQPTVRARGWTKPAAATKVMKRNDGRPTQSRLRAESRNTVSNRLKGGQ